jgi:hypothetical protein
MQRHSRQASDKEVIRKVMDPAYVSAFAALGGALIGGLTSFATSWITQQTQAREQQLIHKLTRQEELYKGFIEEASRLYVDSLVHDSPDVSQLVRLYAMISRMRVLSSTKTVENADKVARMIVNTYLAPNKTLPELRDMVNSGALDPLRDFSEASRAELQRFGFV